jgi:hypothetical protein
MSRKWEFGSLRENLPKAGQTGAHLADSYVVFFPDSASDGALQPIRGLTTGQTGHGSMSRLDQATTASCVMLAP